MVLETNKNRIVLLVSILPGLHLRALQRLTGLSFNSIRYHVRALTKSGEIVRSEEGGYSRLYPVGTSEHDKSLYSVLRSPTDRRIIQTIASCTAITHFDLCSLTGLAKSTISEHMAKLVASGIVKTIHKTAGKVEYELVDPEHTRRLVTLENATLIGKATDRFIDLWNF